MTGVVVVFVGLVLVGVVVGLSGVDGGGVLGGGVLGGGVLGGGVFTGVLGGGVYVGVDVSLIWSLSGSVNSAWGTPSRAVFMNASQVFSGQLPPKNAGSSLYGSRSDSPVAPAR